MNHHSPYHKTPQSCSAQAPSLTTESIQVLLHKLGGSWQINSNGHLYKEYLFSNFIEAMTLANQIAVVAEQEGHHPDLGIHWGKCTVEIWTHAANGLTEKDFILATKIEALT